MKRLLYLVLFLFFAGAAYAQPNNSCTPNSNLSGTGTLLADAVYITPANGTMPDANSNQYYEEVFAFQFLNDVSQPPLGTFDIVSAEILSVSNLPSGWSLEANSGNAADNPLSTTPPMLFNDPPTSPSVGPYGCLTIYGTHGCIDPNLLGANDTLTIDVEIEVSVGFTSLTETAQIKLRYINDPSCVLDITPSIASASICQGNSQAITVSGADTYEWFDGNFSTSLGTGDSINYSNTTPGSYEVYVIGTETATSKSDTDTVVINVNANPDITLQGSVDPTCSAAGSIQVAVNGGTSPFAISISPDPNSISPLTAGTANILNLPANNYTISVEDANACVDTVLDTLDAPPSSPPAPAASNITVCAGTDTFAVVTSAQSTNGTFVWYDDAALTSQVTTGDTLFLTGLATGNIDYYVREEIPGCNGAATTVTVAVDNCPTVSCTPVTVPAGTPFGFDPQPAPNGEINVAYDETVQMILPSSSTELGVPGGLPIDSFRVVGVVGMPTGLSWETSQGTTLPQGIQNPPNNQPTECFRITGTPLVTTTANDSVYFQMEAIVMGFAAPTTLALHIPIQGPGGAPVVSTAPSNPTVCNGSSVALTAQGATTYEWFSDAALTNSIGTGATQTLTPTATTNYWIVGTNSGLSDTTVVTVNVISCGAGLPCTPTAPAANDPWGFDPNPAPNGIVGSYYQETASLIFPGNSADVGLVGLHIDIDSISVNSIYSLPAGLSYYTNQGGSLPQMYVANPVGTKPYGCVTFLGTPTAPTVSTDSVYFALTVYAQGISIPLTVGYHIPIDANTTPPNVSITPTSASICNGQSITLTGNGADSYEWQVNGTAVSLADSFVFSGTSTTEVVLIGTDAGSGLSANDTIEITVTNCGALQFSSQLSDANCNGGSTGEISFLSSQSLTYSIDGGMTSQTSGLFTGLGAGAYSCVVSDGTNDSTFTLTINEPTAIVFSATTGATSCANGADGSVSFSAATGGVPPYTYSVGGQNFTQNTTIGGLTGGIYDVFVQDANGCQTSQSVTITSPDTISITGLVVHPTAVGATDGEIDLTAVGGTAPYDFLWSSGDGTEDVSGLGEGSFTVTVTDANGCTKTATFTLSASSSRADALSGLSATVFPNPTSGKVMVQTTQEAGQVLNVNVFDLSGRLVQTAELTTGTAVLDISTQAAGVYLLELTAGNRREVKRVVLR